MINGESGDIGTSALQITKLLGASVTGVCSTTNLDIVRTLGTDEVFDYTREDFTKSKQRYDLVFDVVVKSSF